MLDSRPNDLSIDTDVLVVDLDGTLLLGDSLVEQVLWLLRHRPWQLLAVFAAWMRDRSRVSLKAALASRAIDMPVQRLPMRTDVLERVRAAHRAGRRTVLATGAHRLIADRIAKQVGVFHDVIATELVNRKGAAKLAAVRERIGPASFTYMGNARADVPLWQAATHAVIVASHAQARRLSRSVPGAELMETPSPTLRDWRRILRVHQWSKNLLVLMPVIAAHQWRDRQTITAGLLAFAAASLLASGVYVANDLLDVHADRDQAGDRRRPIAEGVVPATSAALAAPVLMLAAFLVTSLQPPDARNAQYALMAAYVGVNAVYSTLLKRVLVLDVLVLALMYLWRIMLGSAASGIVLSDWLLAFSVFFFAGLASAKRCIEISHLPHDDAPDEQHRPFSNRAYRHGDLSVLRSIGVGTSLVSVLVLALYLKDPATAGLYHRPQALWGAVLLTLYWVGRFWVLVGRGDVASDPVAFAVRDGATYAVFMAVLASLAIAL